MSDEHFTVDGTLIEAVTDPAELSVNTSKQGL
jgi:hypothetical protein